MSYHEHEKVVYTADATPPDGDEAAAGEATAKLAALDEQVQDMAALLVEAAERERDLRAEVHALRAGIDGMRNRLDVLGDAVREAEQRRTILELREEAARLREVARLRTEIEQLQGPAPLAISA